MDDLRFVLESIINIDYKEREFDCIRPILLDDSLIPIPFLGNILEAKVVTSTICSHSKEYSNDYPLVFLKQKDNFANLLNNFDEHSFCHYFVFLEEILNNIGCSFYTNKVNEGKYDYACHINLIPYSINCNYSDLRINPRKDLKVLSQGFIKKILSESNIELFIIQGLEGIEFLQEELLFTPDVFILKNDYLEDERFYFNKNICLNKNNKPIKFIGSSKFNLHNQETLIKIIKLCR